MSAAAEPKSSAAAADSNRLRRPFPGQPSSSAARAGYRPGTPMGRRGRPIVIGRCRRRFFLELPLLRSVDNLRRLRQKTGRPEDSPNSPDRPAKRAASTTEYWLSASPTVSTCAVGKRFAPCIVFYNIHETPETGCSMIVAPTGTETAPWRADRCRWYHPIPRLSFTIRRSILGGTAFDKPRWRKRARRHETSKSRWPTCYPGAAGV